jgi:hypothetical protein
MLAGEGLNRSGAKAHRASISATACMAHLGDSAMAEVRVFSYLPNPRVWKATIGGVALEVRIGFEECKPDKTDVFLVAQPVGTVPAALGGEVRVGIF